MIRYLGIDWGTVRIGLALGDGETKIATPFKTVKNLAEVLEIIKAEEIGSIVIGQPFSLVDKTFSINNEFGNFVSQLKEKVKMPIELVDERLTSKNADALTGNRKGDSGRDEIAAMLILQSYFDKV